MKKCILRKVMTAFFICLTVPLWLLCSNAAWAEESGGRHHIDNPVQSVTPESGEGNGAVSEKKLTLMIYLCGSNLESGGGAATSDLYEIQHSFVNREEVNVVVAAGGTKEWKNAFSAQETAIYELGSFNAWNKAENLYADEDKGIPANMGEQSTLLALLNYAWENDPAEEYALIFWDHGGGPMSGVCWDMQWAGNNLSMQELCGALEESPFAGKKLSWVGFDACLMASLETAHMMAPYASYMIASEETEPASGWNYSFMKDIENDTDGGVTGERIVESYFEGSEDSGAGITLSCMDLSRITDLEEKLGLFFSELSGKLNEKTFSNLSNRRYRTHEFGRADEDDQHLDLVDLGDLVRNYAPYAVTESRNLLDAMDQFIVCSRTGIPQCYGISIYHPYYNKLYYQRLWKDTVQSVGVSSSYADYLENFARIWMDSSLGQWEDLSGIRSAGEAGDEQTFSFRLTEDQKEHFAHARLLILEEVGSGSDISSDPGYFPVYESEPVQPDENGILTVPYAGQTLYVVNDRDEIVAGPISYHVSDTGSVQIFANYVDEEGRAEERVAYTMFECEPAAPGTDLPVLEHYIFDTEIGSFTNRRKVPVKNYSYVYFVSGTRKATYVDGQLAAFRDWEAGDWKAGYIFNLPGAFHFRFFDSLQNSARLYACFQISDTQSVVHSTEMIGIENPNESPVAFVKDQYRDGQLQCTVSGRLVHSRLSRFLELTIKITNLTDHRMDIDLANGNIVANGMRSLKNSAARGLDTYLDPGESTTQAYRFEDYTLSGLSGINEIKIYMTCQERTEDGADPVEKEIVLIPQKLDVSAAAAHFDEAEALAEFEKDGFSMRLLSLGEDDAGNLHGILGLRNFSGKTYLQEFDSLIVNDIMIGLDEVKQVTLPDGTESYLKFTGNNSQDYWGYFDRKAGSSHLVLSDVLGTEGVGEIRSIAFCDTQSGELNDPDDVEEDSGSVILSLSSPFPYKKMTDTQKPERTVLCTIGDVVISGESLLLTDEKAVISLMLENQGAEDEVVLIDNWVFNDTEEGAFSEKFLVPSGTERRIYAGQNDYKDAGDELSEVSFRICTKSGDIPESREVVIVFEKPFNPDSGAYRAVSFAEADFTVSGFDLPESSGPFFETDISCPEKIVSCRRELSFDLPERFMQGDSPYVTGVYAGIMREFPDHSIFLPEYEGILDSDRILQQLAWVQLFEADKDPGRYSGLYSGLILVSEKYPAVSFLMLKRSEEASPDGSYFLAGSRHLRPLDELDPTGSVWLSLKADLCINIRYNPSGGGSARVISFSIQDDPVFSRETGSWPPSYFKEITSDDGVPVFRRNEDGTLQWTYRNVFPDGFNLPLDGKPVKLKLIPVEDYDPNIVILYRVFLSDGTEICFEGGDY